jgi:hypothetical protein
MEIRGGRIWTGELVVFILGFFARAFCIYCAVFGV